MLFLAFPVFQQGEQADSVFFLLSGLLTGDFPESRQEVPERADEVGLRAGCHMSRPRDDHRHTDSALIHVTLVSSQDAVAVEEVGVGPSFLMRTVVAREDDDGTDGSGYIFNESSRGVAGGGGGGAGTNDSGNYGGLGGEPYGGRGDGDNVSDNNATGPGGGGGGGQEGSSISHGSGSISYGDGTNGGNGYRGQAWMRIHRS